MAASCASNDSSDSGLGCTEAGACNANGGIDIREANGAEVSGIRVASGSHGAVSYIGQRQNPSRHAQGFTRALQRRLLPQVFRSRVCSPPRIYPGFSS